MTEQQWLQSENDDLRRLTRQAIEKYDNGETTMQTLEHQLGLLITGTLRKVYDHAFEQGVLGAELDGDSEEELGNIDLDFEADDPEEGDNL